MRASALVRHAAALVLFQAAATAVAGTFSIAPIRVELDGSHRTAVLTIRNEDESPLVIQVRAVDWSQRSGEDQYADTTNLLTAPPVLNIPAKGEHIVRVALRHWEDAVREISYRLSFQEVPQEPPDGLKGLRVVLHMSVPVFVIPSDHAGSAQLSWTAQWLTDGSLQIEAANRGASHVQVSDFTLGFGDGSVSVRSGSSKYVLPGSWMRWTVKPPDGVDRAAPIHIHGMSDRGEFSAAVSWSAS